MPKLEKMPRESFIFKKTKQLLLICLQNAQNKGGLDLFKTKLLVKLEFNNKMKPHEKDELREIINSFGIPAVAETL